MVAQPLKARTINATGSIRKGADMVNAFVVIFIKIVFKKP
jgi:hypothetical protein